MQQRHLWLAALLLLPLLGMSVRAAGRAEQAFAELGIELGAALRWSWWGGPSLVAEAARAGGASWSAQLPRVEMELAWLPLLWGSTQPVRLILTGPELRIDLDAWMQPTQVAESAVALPWSWGQGQLELCWRAVPVVRLERCQGNARGNFRAATVAVFNWDEGRVEELAWSVGQVRGWGVWSRGSWDLSGQEEGSRLWLSADSWDALLAWRANQVGGEISNFELCGAALQIGGEGLWCGQEPLLLWGQARARDALALGQGLREGHRLLAGCPIATNVAMEFRTIQPPLQGSFELTSGGGKPAGRLRAVGVDLGWHEDDAGEGRLSATLEALELPAAMPLAGLGSGRLQAHWGPAAKRLIWGQMRVEGGHLRAPRLDRAIQRATPFGSLRGLRFERLVGPFSVELGSRAGELLSLQVEVQAWDAPETHLVGALSLADSLRGSLEVVLSGGAAAHATALPGLPWEDTRRDWFETRLDLDGTWAAPRASWPGASGRDSLQVIATRRLVDALRASLEAALGLPDGGLEDPAAEPAYDQALELFRQRRRARGQ